MMKNDNLIAQIKPGDLVDFGGHGALYVISIFLKTFWVTDNKDDRFNCTADGWYVPKQKAVKILETGETINGNK